MTLALALTVTTVPGPLFLAGGGTTPLPLVREFIRHTGPDGLIVVLGQTREEPVNAESSRELLLENGAKNVIVLTWSRRTPADDRRTQDLLRRAKGIWVPGGDQHLFIQRWSVPFAQSTVKAAWQRGAAYFGTSAGAMITGDWMLPGGQDPIISGLGLVPLVIDTHYRDRDRQTRLALAFRDSNLPSAVGLSEGEWLRWQPQKGWSVGAGNPEWLGKKEPAVWPR